MFAITTTTSLTTSSRSSYHWYSCCQVLGLTHKIVLKKTAVNRIIIIDNHIEFGHGEAAEWSVGQRSLVSVRVVSLVVNEKSDDCSQRWYSH